MRPALKPAGSGMAVHAPLYRTSTRIFGAASYHGIDQVRLIGDQGNLIATWGEWGCLFYTLPIHIHLLYYIRLFYRYQSSKEIVKGWS